MPNLISFKFTIPETTPGEKISIFGQILSRTRRQKLQKILFYLIWISINNYDKFV